ncbi:hypothetical protein K501DRAFT_273289 [Backusella circina FSU 941]|nr:hypothetical protein K501DRAFT_273289 [Backusella circina FSU 941]
MIDPITNIDEKFDNLDIAEYDIRNAKNTLYGSRTTSFLGEFDTILNEHSNDIIYAQFSSSECMIGFSTLEMKKYRLPFEIHAIVTDKGEFLGIILDFSAAQKLGFQYAYNYHFFNGTNDTGDDDQLNGLSHVKECYMEWMQSVQRMAQNANIVLQSQADGRLLERFCTQGITQRYGQAIRPFRMKKLKTSSYKKRQ